MDVREAYDRWSAVYDTDENRTRDLDGALLRALDWPWASLDVVEIGCGTGKNSAWLAPRCRSLVGLDLSPGMLAKARARVPGATFLEADVSRPWPLGDAVADVVLADLVLEHVRDLAGPLAEARRVLRPGGRLRICELHPYRQLAGAQARFTEGEREVRVPAFTHPVSEFVNAGLAAGFRVERVDEDQAEGDAVPRLFTLVLRA